MSGLTVAGNCPDCGASILVGHVRHVCPQIISESDEGGFTSSISFQSDTIIVRRSDLTGPVNDTSEKA